MLYSLFIDNTISYSMNSQRCKMSFSKSSLFSLLDFTNYIIDYIQVAESIKQRRRVMQPFTSL